MNDPSTTATLGTGARIFVWVAAILGALNLVDFVFYGWGLHDLLTGAGLLLIAYGTWRNGFGRPQNAAGEPLPVDAGGRIASLLGMALVIAGILLENRG
jgi:hypothetical protein